MTTPELARLVRQLSFAQCTHLTVVERRDGGRSWLTRRLDGGEILDPPIYSSLAAAYRALSFSRE